VSPPAQTHGEGRILVRCEQRDGPAADWYREDSAVRPPNPSRVGPVDVRGVHCDAARPVLPRGRQPTASAARTAGSLIPFFMAGNSNIARPFGSAIPP
jgi:hypothetical protein